MTLDYYGMYAAYMVFHTSYVLQVWSHVYTISLRSTSPIMTLPALSPQMSTTNSLNQLYSRVLFLRRLFFLRTLHAAPTGNIPFQRVLFLVLHKLLATTWLPQTSFFHLVMCVYFLYFQCLDSSLSPITEYSFIVSH